MGSLYSKPKMPDPIVYTPPPAPILPAVASDEPSQADKERAAAIARKRSLPETIFTSFRGVLSQGDWVPQRKNLLGE